jgi:hypothetical protein
MRKFACVLTIVGALFAPLTTPTAGANNQDADGGGCWGQTCAIYGDGCIVAWSGEQVCAR